MFFFLNLIPKKREYDLRCSSHDNLPYSKVRPLYYPVHTNEKHSKKERGCNENLESLGKKIADFSIQYTFLID